MPITLSCPMCKAEFHLADEMSGKQVRCSKCAMLINVPQLTTSEQPSREPAQEDSASMPLGAIQDQARPAAPVPMARSPRPARDGDESDRAARAPARSAARRSRKTPVFVWLVPVLFACLFLVVGGLGAVVMSANRNARNNFRWQKPAPMPAQAWQVQEDKPVAIFEKKDDLGTPPVGEVLREPDAAGVTVDGNLDFTDPADRMRGECLCKVYQVRLVAGRTYTIDMRRKDQGMDPYLRLTDSNGLQLLRDDDGGGDLNARITYTPAVTGDYRIVATTLIRATGPFTLSIRWNQGPEGK